MNERGAEQRLVPMLEARGVVVCRLLDQSPSGRDDRQMAFLPPRSKALGATAAAEHALPSAIPSDIGRLSNLPLSAEAARCMTFPNQPYEEKKFLGR